MRTPSYTAGPEFAAWVNALPKTETHLHLEGSTPRELLAEAFPGRFTTAPAFWSPDFRYESFAQFEALYVGEIMPFYSSAQRYHDAARNVLVAQPWFTRSPAT
jgi:hypothetical protein